MEGFLGQAYLWVKAFHIIFVIFWMAGLFMLPRYFAYHCECAVGSDEDIKWQDREKRLLRIIMNPAMIIVWLLGLSLLFHIGPGAGGWLHLKLLLVLLLTGFHMFLAKSRKAFAAGDRPNDGKFYRLINEVPSIFIIIIVVLAVTKFF